MLYFYERDMLAKHACKHQANMINFEKQKSQLGESTTRNQLEILHVVLCSLRIFFLHFNDEKIETSGGA